MKIACQRGKRENISFLENHFSPAISARVTRSVFPFNKISTEEFNKHIFEKRTWLKWQRGDNKQLSGILEERYAKHWKDEDFRCFEWIFIGSRTLDGERKARENHPLLLSRAVRSQPVNSIRLDDKYLINIISCTTKRFIIFYSFHQLRIFLMNFKTFLIHDLWFFIKYFNIVQQRRAQ